MKVREIAEKLGLNIHVKGDIEKDVSGCYISDLLSDVMANGMEGEIWITIQTHPNIVAVAVIRGLPAIIMTNGRAPQPDTSQKAETEKITIMTTADTSFNIAGKLYNMLNKSLP